MTDRTNAARERFESALADLADSDRWKEWLSLRARFHKYSFSNTLLIAWQAPEATQVAGYKTWQSLGRQVKKGEKGIAIFAPIFVKPRDEDGNVIEGEEKRIAFRSVYVFDVDQTEGAELPTVLRVLAGDSGLTDLSDSLVGHALSEGIEVARETIVGGANGFIDRANKRLVIGSHLDRDASLKTLIHELAHWHDLGTDETGDRAAAEIVAESVAFVVADAYGLDTSDYSVGYVTHWAGGDLTKVRALAERVDRTAKVLLDAVDADLGLAKQTVAVAA